MCGIAGSTLDPWGLDAGAMAGAMIHRGPDDHGIYVDPDGGLSIAARRLSIIDVLGGHQPVSNEDGSVWAVLNGEIYNHAALRERLRGRGHLFESATDTEVLVHLYEDYGESLVHAIEGMYAFAIWDRRARRLTVVRDRFGEKPLFYAERADRLVFASEVSALRAGLTSQPQLDPQALDAFLLLGYVRASTRSFKRSASSTRRQSSPGRSPLHAPTRVCTGRCPHVPLTAARRSPSWPMRAPTSFAARSVVG